MWTGSGDNKSPRGEIGTLKEVHISITDPEKSDRPKPHNRIYLFMEYRDGAYVGCLLFDDAAFCREMGKILSEQCGRTLKEIGAIDLSHLL